MTKPYRHQPARCLATLLLAILTIPIQAVHAQENAAALIARIEAPPSAGAGELDALTMPALMARLQVPGVSIAVVKDFKLHWAKAYGVADAQTGRLLDTESRFQAASISKPVTALATMRLARQHRLNLDADINTMITSWQVPRSALTRHQAVTPRSLLSHTSGADDGFGFPGTSRARHCRPWSGFSTASHRRMSARWCLRGRRSRLSNIRAAAWSSCRWH
ncbi:serine hydrolase domain-containing protein [Massilia genomosp. 1]|nr:serine hydrolase domain-containing protein [Massilia genomosp. 1]